MVVATAIPVAEYLSTTYHPDCDYVDGQLQERNAGEMDHGDAQASCVVYVRTKCTGFWAVTEVRVQLRPDRFRIPDVSIVRGGQTQDPYLYHPAVSSRRDSVAGRSRIAPARTHRRLPRLRYSSHLGNRSRNPARLYLHL